ncbi:signal peptidase I [Pseudoxanthomonas sp. GM95]|uniref:signal peptidase I n=1 Tax=Pseudoxanthomonas sp. GM95 TaxID=1881043 RepID=UPI0008D29C07|nr:signal peptidase I [Pseudoxanthomonas sp. GM95]SEM40181.1 signal peptidase I [Pseudoxanthomonas sp. GM95]
MSVSSTSASKSARSAGWRSELPRLALMVCLLFVARSSFANHYVVPSGSMQHTLEIGDRVVVDMRAYGLRLPVTDTVLWPTGTPQRGDVAVFDSPLDGTRLIKRVAAVGGDRVQLHDGHLWINGRALADDDAALERFDARQVRLDLDEGGGPDIDALVVPAGQVLMLGDHRGNSADGRYFGLVPARALYGRAVAVYWRRGDGLGWRQL